MSFEYYIVFTLLILVCALFAGWASLRVHTSYNKYSSVFVSSGLTGAETAKRLLEIEGIYDVNVTRVSGNLTDHFDPKEQVVRLSDGVHDSASLSAVAVAAHEIGHVVQRENGYVPYKLRSWIVPVANIGSRLAVPIVLLGFLLDVFVFSLSGSPAGFYLAMLGVLLYGLSTVFYLVTLPVELNASRRACKMLVEAGIIVEEEKRGARRVLTAAALTYIAALLTSLVYFLRFLVWVLSLFVRSRRK